MREAKRLCNGSLPVVKRGVVVEEATPPCPVRDECLAWALETRFQFGIVGGMSERERKNELRRRVEAGLMPRGY